MHIYSLQISYRLINICPNKTPGVLSDTCLAPSTTGTMHSGSVAWVLSSMRMERNCIFARRGSPAPTHVQHITSAFWERRENEMFAGLCHGVWLMDHSFKAKILCIHVRGVTAHVFIRKHFSTGLSVRHACVLNECMHCFNNCICWNFANAWDKIMEDAEWVNLILIKKRGNKAILCCFSSAVP